MSHSLSSRGIFLILLVTLLLLWAMFMTWPGLDLAVQHYFYESKAGFYLRDHWFPMLVYHSTLVIVKIFVVLLVLVYLYNLIRKQTLFGVTGRVLLFLLGSLAIGPGLIVHTGFKEHWGRARPDAVQEFGGTKAFTPFYERAANCDTNCSFVSGHAAAAFYTVAPVLLIPNRRTRRFAIAGAFSYGVLVSLGRLMQGKHFLSDVLFAGWITWAVVWIFYSFLFKPRDA